VSGGLRLVLATVFYADQPPVQVVVHTGSPWSTWLPIAISTFALIVSGAQAYLSHRERKRAMPSIRMHAAYTDHMVMGSVENLRQVVLIRLENRGREDTTITSCDIYSSGGTLVNGLNRQLDATGNRITREAQDEPLPGFSHRQYTIDGSIILGDEIMVIVGFGHGLEIAIHAPINHLGTEKQVSRRKQRKIYRSWEKAKREARAKRELDRVRAQQEP
jgi:hypothetical protein